jgi:murein DD-endopeptidase MepM/ murein hydrolase activator NlpD
MTTKETKRQYPINGKLGKDFKVTSPYGWRVHPIENRKKHHNGTDLWGPKETIPVRAWSQGTVIAAGTSTLTNPDGSLGGVGWYVDVRSKVHGEWFVARYAHLKANSLKVKKGDKVIPGQVLGIMGNTGASTGRHLHFEICKGRKHRWTSDGTGYVNPLKFIDAVIAIDEEKAKIDQPTPKTSTPAPKPKHGA